MFIQNENIPPSVWHQPPCFSKRQKKRRHAASVRACVCWDGSSSGTNYRLTPPQTGHKATRVRGREGSAAAVLFPSLRASGGSGRVGFDGICWCLLLEPLTESLQLGLSTLHHHKQRQLEKNDLLNSGWCMWALWMLWCLVFYLIRRALCLESFWRPAESRDGFFSHEWGTV